MPRHSNLCIKQWLETCKSVQSFHYVVRNKDLKTIQATIQVLLL